MSCASLERLQICLQFGLATARSYQASQILGGQCQQDCPCLDFRCCIDLKNVVRGAHRVGDCGLAPAGFEAFNHGSGRLELAESIASETNPLTARVWVNRVWMHHFGEPLVETPSTRHIVAIGYMA